MGRRGRKRARGPRGSESELMDPKALATLEAAAEAVDLELTDLVDLVADSGLLALPPKDELTAMVTLRDLGLKLWNTSQLVKRDQRGVWFAGLLPVQQTAVVVTLRDRGFSSSAIANDFGLNPNEVTKTWHRHADELGAHVVGIRQNTLVGNMQLVAERAMQGAAENEDWATYWRIQKDLVGTLQSLGIADRAASKVEVSHKFDEQRQAEVEKLLDLERKRLARGEEIKRIEVEVRTERLPDEIRTLDELEAED